MSKVVVVGDPFVRSDVLEKAARQLEIPAPIEVERFEWYPESSKEEFRHVIKIIEHDGPNGFSLPEGLMEAMGNAEYLLVHIAPVSKEMIKAGSKLIVIGTCRGGLEHIDTDELMRHDIQLVHTIRNAEPVADFTVGLFYTVTRNIAISYEQVKQGNWPQGFVNDPYKTVLSNLKVGLIGLGHIGKLVVKKLNALGVEVIAYDPFLDETELRAEGYKVVLKELEEVFREADIVSLHLRVVPETINIVNKDLLSLMKPGSYLINTARPDILHKEDFIETLKTKRIIGAAIDVCWEEPLPAGDPLLELDNLVITSHIAGDTVDAISNSPFLLKNELNELLTKGRCGMLVKLK